VFGSLVTFEVVNSTVGFFRAELASEGDGLGDRVEDHDTAVLVPDHMHAISTQQRVGRSIRGGGRR